MFGENRTLITRLAASVEDVDIENSDERRVVGIN